MSNLNPAGPIILPQVLPQRLLQKLQELSRNLRLNPQGVMTEDNELCFRWGANNYPVLNIIHHSYLLEVAEKVFGEKLKPSYSFLSLYYEGKGICPYHADRPQCYRTIDICLNQNEIWPIYIASSFDRILSKEELIQQRGEIQKKGKRYDLNPGDALCFAGSAHPHWRDVIQPGNFCDLAFFHFVPENFTGSLD
jgi:hypothetical protein